MKKLWLTALMAFLLIGFNVQAQSVIGTWKTIDDNTGEARSHVQIYEDGGKVYGKITKLLNPSEPNPICDDCKDDRKDQSIEGMQIIRGLKKSKNEYGKGTILDPENGKVYRCKIWLKDNETLKVRGYVAMFFRTQTWYRVD